MLQMDRALPSVLSRPDSNGVQSSEMALTSSLRDDSTHAPLPEPVDDLGHGHANYPNIMRSGSNCSINAWLMASLDAVEGKCVVIDM